MAVKVMIKRKVPATTAKKMIPLFRKMRAMATNQPGYISGETLKRLDSPDEFVVISTWHSSEDWKNWLESQERKTIQDEIDVLLGGQTEYEIYHYGFTE
jgi:heme-degrading monooxygenase HmoA